MTRLHELTLLRLTAQGIVDPDSRSARDAVHRLTAVQAQDHPGAVTSVALRTAARTRAGVEAALTAGEVVKSWPMRGTLHFVIAEDLPWMLELTASRSVSGQAARRAQLELNDADLERARELAIAALCGGRELGRTALLKTWADAGLSIAGQRGYHLLVHLCQTATLCFGPVRDGEQQLVLLAEWVPHPRRPERDEALGELARRYFQGHGPATVKDFTQWTKLLAADVRTAVALARPELESLTVDGVEYLLDPLVPEHLAADRKAARGVFLLPGFDEYMLGYTNRSAALPVEFADRIVPGGNGVFRPTVIADGQVVATWRRTGRGGAQALEVTAFGALPDKVTKAIAKVYAALPS
jgi:hypothetical protein